MDLKHLSSKFKSFLAKTLVNIKSRIASEFKQEELTQEVYEGILIAKINAIKEQLLRTDKTFLVGLILSEKITDDSDVHYYYEKLQNYKKVLSDSKK